MTIVGENISVGGDLSAAAGGEYKPCTREDPEMFFPEPEMTRSYHGRRRPTDEAQRAIAVYAKCSIRSACLSEALERDEKVGIWGGMTTDQRDRLKRQRLLRDESA